jgi:hypothetical protein
MEEWLQQQAAFNNGVLRVARFWNIENSASKRDEMLNTELDNLMDLLHDANSTIHFARDLTRVQLKSILSLKMSDVRMQLAAQSNPGTSQYSHGFQQSAMGILCA